MHIGLPSSDSVLRSETRPNWKRSEMAWCFVFFCGEVDMVQWDGKYQVIYCPSQTKRKKWREKGDKVLGCVLNWDACVLNASSFSLIPHVWALKCHLTFLFKIISLSLSLSIPINSFLFIFYPVIIASEFYKPKRIEGGRRGSRRRQLYKINISAGTLFLSLGLVWCFHCFAFPHMLTSSSRSPCGLRLFLRCWALGQSPMWKLVPDSTL